MNTLFNFVFYEEEGYAHGRCNCDFVYVVLEECNLAPTGGTSGCVMIVEVAMLNTFNKESLSVTMCPLGLQRVI